MKYTTSYHLPQWDETDRIMRTDFNQMCSDIEAGLKKTAQDAASATAQNASDAAKAAQKAQATADKAVADAAAAQAKADAAYSPDQPPYVIGTYTGPSTASLTINVGFKPSYLIISGGGGNFQLAAGPNTSCYPYLAFTNTGFVVGRNLVTSMAGTVEEPPMLLYTGRGYQYIAFR